MAHHFDHREQQQQHQQQHQHLGPGQRYGDGRSRMRPYDGFQDGDGYGTGHQQGRRGDNQLQPQPQPHFQQRQRQSQSQCQSRDDEYAANWMALHSGWENATAAARSGSRVTLNPAMPGAFNVRPLRVEQSSANDTAVDLTETTSVSTATATDPEADPTTGTDATSNDASAGHEEPILLQARIVEEPTLVHAEPMPDASIAQQVPEQQQQEQRGGNEGNLTSGSHQEGDSEEKRLGSLYHPFVCFVAVLAILGLIALVLVQYLKPEDTTSASGTSIAAPPIMATLGPSPSHHTFLPDYTIDAITQDPMSAQAQAFKWLQNHPEFDTMFDWRKQQLLALVTFYLVTGGDTSWQAEARLGWLNPRIHECYWQVDMNHFDPLCTEEDGKYQQLVLANDDLDGSIPPELALLTEMKLLELWGNHLTGTFPAELGAMTALTFLALNNNQLSGTIPPSALSQWTNLTNLWLNFNDLTGTLPSELGEMTALTTLNLRGLKGLSGTVPEEALQQLTNLEMLQLWDTPSLTGTIPTELCQSSALHRVRVDCDHIQCNCSQCAECL